MRRLKPFGQMIYLPVKVTTSSRRFENGNFILTFLRWSILQVFYWLGVSPHTLGKLYLPIRQKAKKN
ncbi:MAG: hypothetical protein LC768_16100 [Acidobacteria bacterium]|nr:hypothetical protein [Acidobacteriota bacterium]MCA1639822.1 hypothetical protein [Acidobacteriota bacterium]